MPTSMKPSVDISSTTTSSPSSLSETTPSGGSIPLNNVCIEGWSAWINRDIPTTDGGDIEKMTPQELASLCSHGEITDIQCVDSVTLDDWVSLSEATCTVEDGLQCTNLPFPGVPPCRDYKIRYMCNCTGMSVLVMFFWCILCLFLSF